MTGALRAAAASLREPYRVPPSLFVFFTLPLCYIFIAQLIREHGIAYSPAIALDRAIPLQPAWALVYGSLYFWLIFLPVFVVRQPLHLRRTIHAYITVWLASFVCFWFYPTYAPRPAGDTVPGSGFTVWALARLYDMDPPFNCFPSIHVAHSFVSAITIARLHRRVGIAALIGASLVGLSTLFVKQHYVLDVLAGALLAVIACAIFLRIGAREPVPDGSRALVPVFAAITLAVAMLFIGGFWIAYQLQ
jgi:membrane-associated phospholipid phosphatase